MNKYKEDLTPEELNEYPVAGFEGKIILVEEETIPGELLEELRRSRFLGFDTETRPSFKKGVKHSVALLQLSNETTAYLFRINSMGLPGELAGILADPGILKVGVAIHDDIKALRAIRNFKPEGFVELQSMVGDYGIKSAGLKKLTAIVLGYRISKRQQVSNWENDRLTESQIHYAATDAWVCYKIYSALLNAKKKPLNATKSKDNT